MFRRVPFKPSERFSILSRDGYRCQYCGVPAGDIALHIDHIWPVSKGADNNHLNLLTACVTCNSGKHNHLPYGFENTDEHYRLWAIYARKYALKICPRTQEFERTFSQYVHLGLSLFYIVEDADEYGAETVLENMKSNILYEIDGVFK